MMRFNLAHLFVVLSAVRAQDDPCDNVGAPCGTNTPFPSYYTATCSDNAHYVTCRPSIIPFGYFLQYWHCYSGFECTEEMTPDGEYCVPATGLGLEQKRDLLNVVEVTGD